MLQSFFVLYLGRGIVHLDLWFVSLGEIERSSSEQTECKFGTNYVVVARAVVCGLRVWVKSSSTPGIYFRCTMSKVTCMGRGSYRAHGDVDHDIVDIVGRPGKG